MKKTCMLALLGALVTSALAGCGGNVIVESSGGGGSGGGSNNGGSTPTTGTSTSTSTSPPTYCASACALADQYGCLGGSPVSQCVADCLDLFNQLPDCSDELIALYDCALEDIQPGCAMVNTCDAEAQAYSQCTGGVPSCGTDTCVGTEVSCSCQGQCDGVNYTVDCKQADNGIFCSCGAGGQEVGTCYDTSLVCDIFGGCCAGFFFDQEG